MCFLINNIVKQFTFILLSFVLQSKTCRSQIIIYCLTCLLYRMQYITAKEKANNKSYDTVGWITFFNVLIVVLSKK